MKEWDGTVKASDRTPPLLAMATIRLRHSTNLSKKKKIKCLPLCAIQIRIQILHLLSKYYYAVELFYFINIFNLKFAIYFLC